MRKVLYYHTNVTEDWGTWSSIVMEQMVCMKNSGLLKELDELIVTVVVDLGAEPGDVCLRNIILSFYPEARFDIVYNGHLKKYTENRTKQTIWNRAREEFVSKENVVIGYVHTKGVTAVENHLKSLRTDTFINYYLWRQFLNWGVIEQWRGCLQHIGGITPGFKFDVAGVNYFVDPCPHFSGNFWWSTSDYITTLADPATNAWWELIQNTTADAWLRTAGERHKDEMWILSNPKVTTWSSGDIVGPSAINLSAQPIFRNQYT